MGVPHHALAVLLIALLGYGLRLPVKRGTLLSTRLLAFTERRNHSTRTLASTTSFSTPSTAAPSEAMLELLKENDEAFVKQLQRLAYRRAHNSNGVEAQDRRVLLQSIEQRLPSMLPDNVVTICWALGTLRLPPRSSGMLRVTDLLLERLDFTRQELAASPNNLTMVLVGLARLNVMVRPGKDSFLSHALPQALPLMDSQQLSNCIWSLGKIGATWDGLTLRLRRAMGDALVRICSSKTDPLTPQGIANSIFGLSQLRTKWGLLPIAVTDALTAALASRAPKMNEQEVSNSLSGLGRLGVQWSSLPAALRESLCSAVLRHLTEQTSASPQGQQDKKQQRQQKQQKQQQKATYAGQGIAMSIHGLGRMDADFSTLPPTVRAALLQAVAQHAGALNDIEVSNMLYGLGKMGCPFVAGPSTANANASAGGGGGEGGGGGRRDKKKGSTSKGEMAMAGAALGALFSAANREAWRLTGQGVSNSLWGLMLMNTSWALLPASTQASLLRALSREAPRMDEQHVGNAVYALGRMGLTWTALPATLQGGLLDAMTTHAPEMPPAGVVMVMLGLGRLGLGWHALPFGLQDGLTQTIIGILRAPSTGGSGVSAVVHALSTTAPRWADLGAGLQTAVVEAVARAFWQPRAPVPVPAYKTKVAPAVSDAVTAAAATAAAAAALPPTGSLGLHGLLSPPMIGSKPKQLPSSSFSSSSSLQGQGQEEEGPLTLSSLLEMQSSVAAALLLSCPPATTPASSSPSSTTPPSPLAPAPSMAANARAFWESSAAKAPRVKDKDREREREQLGDWDERERASKASMLSKDRPTPRGFSSVAGSPPGQGSGSAPASASAPLPVRLTSRAASPEEVFLFDRDESPASPRPKHLSPTGQWQGHVLGPAQGRGLPPTQGARADQDVQQPGQACAMPGFSSDLSSPFAPEVAPRHGKRDHLVLSLAKMGARWDGLGIGAQQGLMDSLASSLNPTWEGGVVVTEQGMGVVGVLGVLEGLASLGTPWARLRPDVQAAVRSGLRRTAPHMDASSIASAILHLSDLQVPWAELENPASAWGGAGGGTHAALRSAILREANYGPEVLSRLLFGLGRLLRWQDLHPDVRLCLKAALVESQLVASPQAEGVERSLSGLAFMQCGWADLSSSARLSLLSSLHRTAGNATADQTANIVKALGAMSAPFASLPQQVQTCLMDGVSSVGGSLRGEALVSVLAGLRDMGLVWTDLSKKIQSVLTESLEVSLLSSSAPHADKDSSLAPSLSLARGRAASEALEEFGRLGAQWFQVPPSLLLALQAAVVAPLPEPQDQAESEDKARVSEAAGDAVDGDGRGHVVACWLGGMATMGLRLSELGPDAQASVLSWARRIDTLGLSVTELSQALNRLGVLGLSQRSGSGSDDAISAAVLAAVNQVCARGEPAEVAAALLGLALMDFTWQDLPPASVDSIVAAVVRSSSQRKPRSSCRVEEFWLLHAPEEPTLLQQQQQGDEVVGRGRLCSSRHSSLGGTDMTAGACASIMHSLALLCFDSSPQQEQQEHEEGRWKGLRRMHGALATTITRLGVGALSEADKEHVIVYSHVLQHLLLEPGAEGEGEGGGFLLRADPVPLSSSGSCDEYERPPLGDTLQHEVVASLSRAITQAGQADSLIVNADYSPFKGALPVDATIVDKKDGHIVAFLAVDTPSHYTENGVLRRADKLKEDLYRRAHPKAQFVHVSAEQIGHLGSTTVGHELATFLALVRSRCPSTEIPPSPHADALYDWSHCDGWVVRRAANELRSALDCGSGESPLRRTRWQDLAYSWY